MADIFHSLWGTSRSFEAIRQQVLKIGKEIQTEQDKEAEKLFAGDEKPQKQDTLPKPFAMLEADETFVALQGEKQKRAGIKLGVGYEGWGARYATGKGKSFGLLKKFVYIGLEDGEKFAEKLSLFADQRLNLGKVKHLIVGGDGAAWISGTLLGYLPRAVYQLCKFHLNRAIKRALPLMEKSQRQLKEKLRADQIDEALSFLRKLIGRMGRPEAEKAKELITYIDNNRQGINGIKKLKQKLLKEEKAKLRCTGAIEGNIDKVICNRFKKRGARWSIFGSNCLLKIGEKILNQEWDQWWQQVKKFEPLPAATIVPEKRKRINVLVKANQSIWYVYLDHPVPALHGPAQDRGWVERLKERIYCVAN